MKLFIPIMLCLVGCATVAPEGIVGEVIADARGIVSDIDSADPYTAPPGKVHLANAKTKADRIEANGVLTQTAIAKDDKANQKVRDKLNKKEGSIGVKLENLVWFVGLPIGLIWLGLEVGGRFLSNGPALAALKFVFGRRGPTPRPRTITK